MFAASSRHLLCATICAAGLLAAMACPAGAALVAQYNFDGNLNESVTGTFNGTPAGGGSVTFVPSPVGGQAIELTGSVGGPYVTTGAVASAWNIDGNKPRTITAWARTEAFTNAGLWQIGAYALDNKEFSLRTRTSTDGWLGQCYGSADLLFSAPGSLNGWTHLALVHDGTEISAYVNGVFAASETPRTLDTLDTNPLRVGLWHPAHPAFDGRVDQVRVYDHALTPAEVLAEFRADGGYLEDFEGTGGQMPADWYVSGGMNGTRLRSTYGTPDGTWALIPYDNDPNDPPGTMRNVYNGGGDNNTSMTWGPIFTVKDPTASIAFKINGGVYDINADPDSQRNGGTGVALWDIRANDYVREPNGDIRFVTRSSGSGSLESQSISLSGLEDRLVSLVLVDRRVGGWAWAGIDTITAPPGVVQLDPQMHHKVLLEYGFDEPGDFMGWTGDTGSFQIGNTPGGLATRHINLKGTFTVGEGFLSSTTTSWDGPTGTLQSPEFTVAGDIIEFYVAGGNRDNLSFELWVDVDDTGTFTLQRTSRHQADVTEFDYDFWAIRDLAGHQAYLKLVDNNPGTWGHIHVDAIRMVAFAVPEPSSMALALIGGLGLLVYGWRKRHRPARP